MAGRIQKLFSAVALLVASTTPALAITDGELDGDAHPYVGLMVARDADGNRWRCSGTLLSPTVYLTAGHCTEGAVQVGIWFDADVQGGIPANGYPNNPPYKGRAFTHPQYNPNAFFLFDLGVVVLDGAGVTGLSRFGALPRLNVLDALATRRGQQNQTFTAVDYGLQLINPVFVEQERVRMSASPHLIMINVPGFTGDFSILLSNNHSTGGTCFGDSGGPNFIGSSNVIGGVTSFGINGNCAGTGGVYRVDRADDLDWIATFF